MSSVVIAGNTSGTVTLAAPDVAGTTTLTLPATNGTLVTTASGQALTSPTITGTATLNGVNMTPYAMKNKIINGAMQVAQRGTSVALTTSMAYGSVDRWAFYQASSANGVAAQVSSGLTGFQYALKIGRNVGATNVGNINLAQAVETLNSVDLQGQSVTLSFWAKNGANYSGGSLNAFVATGTGTDQSAAALNNGTWTGFSIISTFGQAINTTWTKYTITGTVPSNATQIGVCFYWTPSGTAGADDNVYFTGLQIEKGSVASDFEWRPYGQEFANCQRYFQAQLIDIGNAVIISGNLTSGNGYYGSKTLQVAMRAAPTITYGTQWGVSGFAATAPAADWIGADGFRYYKTANATLSGGYIFQAWSASAEL